MQYLGGKSRISKQIAEVLNMRYLGGKSKIARSIVEAIERERERERVDLSYLYFVEAVQ